MLARVSFSLAALLFGLVSALSGAESSRYTPPRFPSYLKPPKSIDDVMPFARAAVRQTGGRTPLGLVEKGMATLIVTEVRADPMVMQAIKRAYEERGVKVYLASEHELLGVNKEEAIKAIGATQWYTSEQGYMEIRHWLDDLFIEPEVPKKWLKERHLDLFNAVYAKVAWADRVEANDAEGTKMSFEVSEEQAKIWGSAAYLQGHLFLSPYQSTGRFPYSSVDYPALQKKWNAPLQTKVNGVFAGTSNHTGSFPRIEVHVKDGYVTEVKGGGTYGELWREFLKYPKINELNYPYQDKPGYWWFYEAGLGTNPKFFKRPDENMLGNNTSEHNNAGVIHWGFGGSVVHDPEKAEESKAWIDFPKQHGLPKDHWWHIHNMFLTYRVRVRGTKNSWLTLIDKGEVTAYRSPEVRALASRYGDLKEALSEDWIAYILGINAPGKYEDYAKDPWKTFALVMKKVEAGTYEYFYPKAAVKK